MRATDYVLIGLDWVEPVMLLLLHITCSCIFMHTSYTFYIFLYIWIVFGTFLNVSFSPPPPLHLLVYVSASWHLNVSLLRPETLFVLGHLLLLIPPPLLFNSVMRKPERTSRRTSLDEAFIQNAKLFCRTFPTLTYPLSFTVEVRSHCVTSQSPVHPCWSRSFTPTYMDLIIQYLFLLLMFEVRGLWPFWILYLRCSVSRG